MVAAWWVSMNHSTQTINTRAPISPVGSPAGAAASCCLFTGSFRSTGGGVPASRSARAPGEPADRGSDPARDRWSPLGPEAGLLERPDGRVPLLDQPPDEPDDLVGHEIVEDVDRGRERGEELPVLAPDVELVQAVEGGRE